MGRASGQEALRIKAGDKEETPLLTCLGVKPDLISPYQLGKALDWIVRDLLSQDQDLLRQTNKDGKNSFHLIMVHHCSTQLIRELVDKMTCEDVNLRSNKYGRSDPIYWRRSFWDNRECAGWSHNQILEEIDLFARMIELSNGKQDLGQILCSLISGYTNGKILLAAVEYLLENYTQELVHNAQVHATILARISSKKFGPELGVAALRSGVLSKEDLQSCDASTEVKEEIFL